MTVSKQDLFEQLQPPPGGQQALRERLATERSRRRALATRFAALTAATAAAAFVVVWLSMGDAPRRHASPVQPTPSVIDTQRYAHPALADTPPAAPVSVRGDKRHQYAVQPVADTDKAVFYMVSSRSEPVAPSRAEP